MVGINSQPWASAASTKPARPTLMLAHHPEHVGALSHRRPAAAMNEVVVCRLRRREGVGLVQEAANGDAGHQFSRSTVRMQDVSLGAARSASDEAIPFCMPRRRSRLLRCTRRLRLCGSAAGDRDRAKIGEVPTASGRRVQKLACIGLLRMCQALAPPGRVRRCGHAASQRHHRRFAPRRADHG